MIEQATIPHKGHTRLVKWILVILAIWTAALFGLVFLVANFSDDVTADERAIIRMGGGLLLIWVVIGGVIQRVERDRIVGWMKRLSIGWRKRFVFWCVVLALLEEVVTTSMSALGPQLGAETDAAMITASTNYLEVVLLNSVIIFVPMFIAWAWLLGRYDFRPVEVMLLYGLSGMFSEAIAFGAQNFMMMGVWVYVYGLMIYLPAHTIPAERGARPPKWRHWILAIFAPILFAIPFVPLVVAMQQVFGG